MIQCGNGLELETSYELMFSLIEVQCLHTEIFIDVQISIHKNISLFCQLRGPGSNGTPVSVSTPSTNILVSNTTLPKKEPLSLDKCLTLGPGQKIHKMSLENLEVPKIRTC